jgi:hypothetical protein
MLYILHKNGKFIWGEKREFVVVYEFISAYCCAPPETYGIKTHSKIIC